MRLQPFSDFAAIAVDFAQKIGSLKTKHESVAWMSTTAPGLWEVSMRALEGDHRIEPFSHFGVKTQAKNHGLRLDSSR